MKGFIYILKHGNNQQFKVGKTTKQNPFDRLKELDSTGVPEKLKMIACFPVDDVNSEEKIAHNKLQKYHLRREYFGNISDEDIIEIVKDSINTPFITDNISNENDIEIFTALINKDLITFETLCNLTESNSWTAKIELGFNHYYYLKLFYIFTYKNIYPSYLLNRNLRTLKNNELNKFKEDFINKLNDLNIKNYLNKTSNIFSKNPLYPHNILFLGAALFIINDISVGKKSILYSSWKNQIEIFSNSKATLDDRGLNYTSLYSLYDFVSKCKNYRI